MSDTKKHLIKNLVIIMAFILTLTVGLSFYVYDREKKNDELTFKSIGDNYTMQAANSLYEWSEDQLRIAQTIALDPIIIDVCKDPQNEEKLEKANRYMENIKRIHPNFVSGTVALVPDEPFIKKLNYKSVLIDKGTFFISTEEEEVIGKGGPRLSYIREILEGKDKYISEVYLSISHHVPIAVMSASIKDENGKLIGISFAAPRIEKFVDSYISGINYMDTGYLFIVDDRLETIAHPRKEFILNSENTGDRINPVIQRIVDGEVYFGMQFEGSNKHYYNKSILNNDYRESSWYLVFTMEDAEIYKGSRNLIKVLIITIVFIVLIFSVIIYYLLKYEQRNFAEKNILAVNEELEKIIKERTKVIEELSYKDSMTKLYNHKSIFTILDKKIDLFKEKGEIFSVVGIDLDHFKDINDTYGHLVGDEVIIKAAKNILLSCSEFDYAGRQGGEEFMMILSGVGEDEAYERAEVLRLKIEELKFREKGLKITASMGVAQYGGEDLNEFVDKVDSLVYKAKKNGRNNVVKE